MNLVLEEDATHQGGVLPEAPQSKSSQQQQPEHQTAASQQEDQPKDEKRSQDEHAKDDELLRVGFHRTEEG